jgi:mannose-1-phosphate guanylyltransferase
MLHAVIMAGGVGKRFWPASTRHRPKQFLSLLGDETMLQTTAGRIKSLVPDENIWVITNERYVELAREQLPDVPSKNIIGEPIAKNTAPCIAVAASLIKQRDEEAAMIVLPADHLIGDTPAFLSVLQTGVEKANHSQALVTIGIKPTRPETGYGYIEFESSATESVSRQTVQKVRQFREKPDAAAAKEFIADGHFLWNSGMFIWTVSSILRAFEKHLPEVATPAAKLQKEFGKDGDEEALLDFYRSCPSISIDYGIMEKAGEVFVVPGDFGWNDVGSWTALYEVSGKDEHQNVLQNKLTLTEKAAGNIIYGTGKKIIALVGVENLAVVETEEAILVCDLDQAQDVKQIVNKLDGKE